jgi:hypothetical protein
MASIHEGGCVCTAVRFSAHGDPLRSHACHCTFCQRRTGSAFAQVAYFSNENVEVTGGPLTEYVHRSDASGRWLRVAFCATCGTCITIELERRPGEKGIHVGTLDQPGSIKIRRHIWMNSAQDLSLVPSDVEQRRYGLDASDFIEAKGQ